MAKASRRGVNPWAVANAKMGKKGGPKKEAKRERMVKHVKASARKAGRRITSNTRRAR